MRRRSVRTLPPFPEFCADVLGLDPATRAGHVAVAKALDGLSLTAAELTLFRTYTGRERPRPGGYPYGLELTGRQSGKTEQAAARLTYAAVGAVLAGQRDVAVVGMSQDHRASQRVLFSYVQRFFEQPLLRDLVVSRTTDSLTLRGNVRVLVLPCRPAAIRGLRCVCVVLDEVCHFRSTDNMPLDREAWRAALPTLLTTGGKLHALSSPYVASGLAYDLHRQHWGVDDSHVLVWQSPAAVLNPTLAESALAQIRAADPGGAAAEIDGQFLRHVSALLDDDTLAAAVDRGVTVRPPVAGVRYSAFVDVATGTRATGDRWTCAVGHGCRDGTVVLDALLVVAPPFGPGEAAKQTAALCRRYRVADVVGDAFAAGFSGEAFARVGVRYLPAPSPKSDLYLRFAVAVQSGTVRLLDHAALLAELRGLERRRSATKDRVDHRRGGHDDVANSAAGVLALVGQEPRCASPLCEDPDCTGTAPMSLLFTTESRAWDRAHDPATIAAVERGEPVEAVTSTELLELDEEIRRLEAALRGEANDEQA